MIVQIVTHLDVKRTVGRAHSLLPLNTNHFQCFFSGHWLRGGCPRKVADPWGQPVRSSLARRLLIGSVNGRILMISYMLLIYTYIFLEKEISFPRLFMQLAYPNRYLNSKILQTESPLERYFPFCFCLDESYYHSINSWISDL